MTEVQELVRTEGDAALPRPPGTLSTPPGLTPPLLCIIHETAGSPVDPAGAWVDI